MVEYIYDVIRVSAGEPAAITATLKDENGLAITSNCSFKIYKDDLELFSVKGTYANEQWQFILPPLGEGKFEYAIFTGDVSLCFKKALYVM